MDRRKTLIGLSEEFLLVPDKRVIGRVAPLPKLMARLTAKVSEGILVAIGAVNP